MTKENLMTQAMAAMHHAYAPYSGFQVGAALLCGYVTSLADVLPIVIPSIAIYVVVCFICFLLMKKDEKQINKALQQK